MLLVARNAVVRERFKMFVQTCLDGFLHKAKVNPTPKPEKRKKLTSNQHIVNTTTILRQFNAFALPDITRLP